MCQSVRGSGRGRNGFVTRHPGVSAFASTDNSRGCEWPFLSIYRPRSSSGAQVMADTGEPPALDAMTASQSLLLGVNWNQDTLMMLGVPADLATSWSSLDASGRLTVADPLWQSVGFPWDASG
ncbi:hypothetical protein Ptr902_14106 [Pyrenophora tritici-repentis]|nr:hypothetical protein Ptr902_14106 [Pyrenophora tritici-repentis]